MELIKLMGWVGNPSTISTHINIINQPANQSPGAGQAAPKPYLPKNHFQIMCYSNHHGMRGGYGHAAKGMGYGGRFGQGNPWMRGAWFQPPVNIEELGDRYELHLAAPGRTKSDFQISTQGDVLTIASRKQEESDLAARQNWTRREFRTVPFERQFQLNEKIDAEGITASYTDGVLVVTLPKLASAHTPARDVYVA